MGKHGTGKSLKLCLKCNKEFHARVDRVGKFCSKSCSSALKPKRYLRQEKICATCNISFIVKRYRLESALYCSVECRRKNMPSKENHINWKGGISERPYKVRKKIKEIISLQGKCNECESEKLLQGHHLKPYSEFPELGCDEDNIVILCSNCHALKHPGIGNFILKGEKK